MTCSHRFKNGPMTAEQIASAIGVAPTRLRLLLYCLVAAGTADRERRPVLKHCRGKSVFGKGQLVIHGQQIQRHRYKVGRFAQNSRVDPHQNPASEDRLLQFSTIRTRQIPQKYKPKYGLSRTRSFGELRFLIGPNTCRYWLWRSWACYNDHKSVSAY